MTTSGTVGTTVIDVTSFIEHAVRRCGVSASIMTAEQQLSARENLYMLLMDLANRGVNLWCVEKQVLALYNNQKVYNLAVGSVDLLRANYRTIQQPTSSAVSGSGYVGVNYGAGIAVAVATIGFTPSASAAHTLVAETSPDGATWTQVAALATAAALTAGQQYWYDIDNTAAAQYWRIRETTGQTLSGATALFGSSPTEIPMAKLSRDSYTTLPNQDFAGRPLQYWYDKQANQPRVWLWPVPNDPTAQMVAWVHRHIQDVGALTNTLDLPARWYQTVLYQLAFLTGMEIPTVDKDRLVTVKQLGDEHLLRAEDGERDGSPIRFAPNISPYTR